MIKIFKDFVTRTSVMVVGAVTFSLLLTGVAYAAATHFNTPFDVGTATSKYFVVTNLGNVGIATANPQARLHISAGTIPLADATYLVRLSATGESSATGDTINTAAQIGFSNYFDINGSPITAGALTFNSSATDNNGSSVFSYIFKGEVPSQNIAFFQGNLGLGVSVPEAKLDVAGTVKVGSSSAPKGITLYDDVTHAPYCITMHSGSLVSSAGSCN